MVHSTVVCYCIQIACDLFTLVYVHSIISLYFFFFYFLYVFISTCNMYVLCLYLFQLLSTWAAIPISYIFSFLFSNSLIAFALLIIFHYFLFFVSCSFLNISMFFIPFPLPQMLLLTKSLVSPKDAKILYYIFLLHPTFGLVQTNTHKGCIIWQICLLSFYSCSLGNGLSDMYINQINKIECTKSPQFEL